MKRTLLFLLIALSVKAGAQQTANGPKRLDNDMVHFFEGTWTGAGAFSNGQKIAADITFSLALDSAWLVCTHTDQAPNRYKAVSYWGVDRKTGEFEAYSFDNFQGHRQFQTNGWNNDSIVLTTSMPNGNATFYQHFIYEKVSATSFKFTYETSADGTVWKMGDYLVFTRHPSR